LLAIRIWLLLTIIAVSLTGTPAFAQGATVVRVDPSALSAQVNDTFDLSIRVDNIANLAAFELHLSFDPSVLKVTDVSNSGFVAADFTAQNTFDNTAGTIDYAVAQMNRAPAQGSGALLNIAFSAKANGSSSVTLRATQAVPSGLLLSDSNGMAIQASWMDGAVNVGAGPTSTPTRTNSPTFTNTPVANTPTRTGTPITPNITITPTRTPTITSTPIPPGPRIHVVRFGETLFCIGRAYGVSPWAIADTNGIWWPYIIFPYQRLRIPDVPWAPVPAGPVCQAQFTTPVPHPHPASTVTPTTAPTAPPPVCRAIYIVCPGDTLYGIAMRYGVSYAEIARINQIPNARLIYAGQRLCIP
jgi:LysM repeat protein